MGKAGKMGTGVQNAIGGVEGAIADNIPKVVTGAVGALSVAANKVAEKVPEGVKTFTKEQSRVGIIDNPLDRKISVLDDSMPKPEAKASAVGEVTVFGEKIITPKVLTKAEKISARPETIEVQRWEGLVEDYPKYSPEQLGKAFEVENFLIENGVPEPLIQGTVLSAKIDTVKIIPALKEDVVTYKFFGKRVKGQDYYYTPDDLTHLPKERRQDVLALPEYNSAENWEMVTIKAGTPAIKGEISPNFEKQGGGTQFYLPLGKEGTQVFLKN